LCDNGTEREGFLHFVRVAKALLQIFRKVFIRLGYNSGETLKKFVATLAIVRHLPAALQNKSHKSFMEATVQKS